MGGGRARAAVGLVRRAGGGHRLADVLLGVADPGGRLPTTFPQRLADVACHALADERVYPGRDGKVVYAEGVFMGYRHFDAQRIAPRFPFGHGLSYARFEYGALAVEPWATSGTRLEMRNAGERAGTEVVQLYVAPVAAGVPSSAAAARGLREGRPAAGRSADGHAPRRAARVLDAGTKRTRLAPAPGVYELRAGRSSRAIRSTARLVVR